MEATAGLEPLDAGLDLGQAVPGTWTWAWSHGSGNWQGRLVVTPCSMTGRGPTQRSRLAGRVLF